jgi:UDP-N-acetylmuramoylalanine--D-glutamate ligase
MDEYVEAKRNILRYQSSWDTAVLNHDNDITRAFAESARGEVRFFSLKGRVENGVYLSGDTIYEASGGKAVPIVDTSQIFLPGTHNIENYMAAFAATRGLAGNDTRVQITETFKGVAHRIELVRTLRGVR